METHKLVLSESIQNWQKWDKLTPVDSLIFFFLQVVLSLESRFKYLLERLFKYVIVHILNDFFFFFSFFALLSFLAQ